MGGWYAEVITLLHMWHSSGTSWQAVEFLICFLILDVYVQACAILKAVSNLGADAYFVAALAWVLLILVLGFFVHVLDNVIDTVYVCYAIDRDRGEVCKQEVHEVYVNLPIRRNHRSSLANRTVGV